MHGGARQTFGPNVGFKILTCGSAKQAFCPNVRLKAWHGGARQTFGLLESANYGHSVQLGYLEGLGRVGQSLGTS